MRIMMFIAFVCFLAQVSEGAELGARFESYEDMHLKSDYGALFFAEGSAQSGEIPANHRFVAIEGDGELTLPSQNGYCFVLNHYNKQLGFQNVIRQYYGIITKWSDDRKLQVDSVRKRIIPTADEESEDVPDVCMDGLLDVSKIEINFGMYKARSRTISFKLQ
jgi:hypothetical protein